MQEMTQQVDDKREHDRFAAKLHRESSTLSVQQGVFEHGEVSSPSLTIVITTKWCAISPSSSKIIVKNFLFTIFT